MTTFARVELYPCFEIQTGTDSGGNPVYTKYYEDSFHKPRFPTAVSPFTNLPQIRNRVYRFTNVTPRKNHELDEMELPIGPDYVETVLTPMREHPKLICI